MEWKVSFDIKDYIRDWSDQKIQTIYMGISINIEIKDTECTVILKGEKDVEKTFYLIWELLFLYDGYFYEPKELIINGCRQDVNSLIKLPFYKSDKLWHSSELLRRGNRIFSIDVLDAYDVFRNTGTKNKKMTHAILNSFYYLHSEAYKALQPNHRLSLLLNIGDGFISNTIKDTHNIKSNYDKLFKKKLDSEKIKHGMRLLGMEAEQFKYNLYEERNQFDHYLYSENSLTTFIINSEDHKSRYMIWYFIYIMDLVLRINILNEIGVDVDKEVSQYALDVIVDWIIYENEINEECVTPYYHMKQIERKMMSEE